MDWVTVDFNYERDIDYIVEISKQPTTICDSIEETVDLEGVGQYQRFEAKF